MLLNAARAEMCRPPIDLACVRSVLSVEQLGALARHCPRGWRSQRARRACRPLAEGAVREASRADRCPAGGTARGGRPDPRLRPLTRGRPLPRPPRGRRDRSEHDRHDVPASSNDRRAAAQPVARTAARYNDLAIRVTYEIPGSAAIRDTTAQQGRLQRALWRLAGESLNAHPRDTAPRLYVDSLNDMIRWRGPVRLSGLNNYACPMQCYGSSCSAPLSRWASSLSTSRYSERG